ncbi:hypothetical protein AAFC00_000157 [Neodothiora populina]
MSSHYRSSSPGGRRIANPGRVSDPYYPTYGSPRGSTERVIPISSTTFINAPRGRESLDGYVTRPRRSTLTEPGRPSSAHVHTHAHTHTHPRPSTAVVHTHVDRVPSPLNRSGRGPSDQPRAPDYHVTPASSSSTPSRREYNTHKKVYSIDEGKSHLVADINIQPARSARRNSVDRNGYRTHGSSAYTSSHRNVYHVNGARKDHVDIDQGFSYTDPAGMYRDTKPRRHTRSDSVEAAARPRPSSMIIDPYPSRPSAREGGPPTSRALDRYNDSLPIQAPVLGAGLGATLGAALGSGLQRGGSLRDSARAPPVTQSVYHEVPAPYLTSQERHHATSNKRHSASLHQERLPERRETHPQSRDTYIREPYEERRDPRDADRSRVPPPRLYEDHSVETRGFGIRAPARARDESLDRRDAYLNSAAAASRESVLPRPNRDEGRREQERRDRELEYARELERKDRHDRERARDRDRDRDRREPDRQERDRPRDDLGYASERDRDRPRPARESAPYREQDRDRRDNEKYSTTPKTSAEGLSNILPAAVGSLSGLGAAAAAVGAIAKGRDKDRGRHSPPSDSGREDEGRRRRDREHHRAPDDPSSSDREYRDVEKRRRDTDRERSVSDPARTNVDPEEDFKRRFQQAQRELGNTEPGTSRSSRNESDADRDSERRRRERDRGETARHGDASQQESPPYRTRKRSPSESRATGGPSIQSDREDPAREGRVRIVDPPKEGEDQQPLKGILRRPTEKFPEDPNPIREGVAPLKDAKDKDIPHDARWTKISRELVNPECLEEAKERFEEREDCVIVLRVLTKEEIQKLADRTAAIRYARFEEVDRARRGDRRRRDKDHDRRDRDEYSDHSEDEYAPKEPRLLEAPSSSQDTASSFNGDRRRDRERDRGDRDYVGRGGTSGA